MEVWYNHAQCSRNKAQYIREAGIQCPPLAGVAQSVGGGCIVSKHKGECKKTAGDNGC